MRYRFIGDTVLTVPFLRNLREAFPQARIDLLIEPFSGEVIAGCPYVDRVVPFTFKTIHKYSQASDRGKIAGHLHYRKLIAGERYDAVFVLKRSLSSALLVWAARIPRRIGFSTEGRQWLLSDGVKYQNDQHEVENFLDCLRAVDVPISSRHLELWPLPEFDQATAARFQKAGWGDNDLKIIIHPAASLAAKKWPADRFAAVMKILQERYGARFVYTGAAGDSALYEEIESHGRFGGMNLCGITSLRENISVYRACNLFFGVDSGPMHMAAAAGVRVVALFGPTNEVKWGPWGTGHRIITKRLACYPCKPHKCRDNECMRLITVPDALDSLEYTITEIRSPGSTQRG